MDNFRVIYRILRYLEKAMDYDEPDLEQISAKALSITEQRWTAIMAMLTTQGYIDGMTVKRSLDEEITVCISRPSITLKGLEYLQENSLMKKAAEIAKGIAEVIH